MAFLYCTASICFVQVPLLNMTMGVRWGNRTIFHRSMFLVRVLLSLFPLVFVIWSGEALPVQDKQSQTNEVRFLFQEFHRHYQMHVGQYLLSSLFCWLKITVLQSFNTGNAEKINSGDPMLQTTEMYIIFQILSKEEDGLKMITYVAELNLTSEELADLDAELLNGKLWEKSDKSSKDKSPCKLFFWKTFSSC